MSDDATPRLNLPYLAAAQAQKHVTLNEALAALDGLVQTAIESRTLAAQPSAPAEGALHILPADRSGPDWSLHPPGALLRFEIGGWERLADPVGALAYVKDEGRLLLRRAEGWKDLGGALGALHGLERLGVGTTADAMNPLSVRANKALFAARPTAEGGDGDLRFTLSKESAADVLSLLFQSGFSGRAEIGLTGDDQLRVKVSTDGAVWRDALVLDGATGAAKLRAPAEISANAGALPPPPGDTVLRLAGADGAQSRMVFDTFGVGTTGNCIFRYARGQAAAPSACRAGDVIGQFSAFGRGETGYSNSSRAQVRFMAAEDWTDTAQGAAVTFLVTPPGQATASEAARIAANGALQLIGRAAPPANPEAGQLYWDSALRRFRGYDGAAWMDL